MRLTRLIRTEFESDVPTCIREQLVQYVLDHPAELYVLPPNVKYQLLKAVLPHWLPLPGELVGLMLDYYSSFCPRCQQVKDYMMSCGQCGEYKCSACMVPSQGQWFCVEHKVSVCESCDHTFSAGNRQPCEGCARWFCLNCAASLTCRLCTDRNCYRCQEEVGRMSCGHEVCADHLYLCKDVCANCGKRNCCLTSSFTDLFIVDRDEDTTWKWTCPEC